MLLFSAYSLPLDRNGDLKKAQSTVKWPVPSGCQLKVTLSSVLLPTRLDYFFSYIKTELNVSVPTSNSIRSKSKWKYSVIDKTVTKRLSFENLVFNCSLCLQQIADTC